MDFASLSFSPLLLSASQRVIFSRLRKYEQKSDDDNMSDLPENEWLIYCMLTLHTASPHLHIASSLLHSTAMNQ